MSTCASVPTCPAGSLLRYRSEADEWDLLPGPTDWGNYRIVGAADGVVAYSGSDGSYYRFLADDDRWVALPDDPIPVYDRSLVEYSGHFFLFGTSSTGDEKTKLAAAYDPKADAWEELASSNSQGYQVWRAGPLLYLNPHFNNAGGGIYDPSTDAWSPLSDPPYHDLAGILGEDEATYEYADGWVFDTRTDDWLEIEPRPDSSEVYDEVIAESPNHELVVFGGQRWVRSVDGQLLNDVWLWMPPS